MSESLPSAQQISAELDQSNIQKQAEDMAVNNAVEQVRQKRITVQAAVNDIANPNPVKIVLMIVGIMLLVTLIYKFLFAPNLTGKWLDIDNVEYQIDHPVLFDQIKIVVKNEEILADLNDNLIMFGNYVAIWDYADKIYIVNGGVLERVKE